MSLEIYILIGVVAGALTVVSVAYYMGAKAGEAKYKIKVAKQSQKVRESNDETIKKAITAKRSSATRSVSDDPNNRSRKRS